jgi:rubredoxin
MSDDEQGNDDSADAQPLNYARHADGQYVVVARFPNRFEAGLAQAKLQDEDIGSFLETDTAWAMLPVVPSGGLQLTVLREELERAQQILSTTPATRWLVIPGALPVYSGMVCPACKSDQVAFVPMSEWFKLLCVLSVGLAWLLVPRTWKCTACGKTWRGG